MSGQCLKKSLQISSLQGKYALLPVFCQCIVLKVLIVLKLINCIKTNCIKINCIKSINCIKTQCN